MKGYMLPKDGALDSSEQTLDALANWQTLTINAVGTVIEFWGFKHNQGKVWALLFLLGQPMSAADIQSSLELSKGAVSMIVRELENWGVIRRVRLANNNSWHFVAEVDLMRMIGQVFQQREVQVVKRVREDLEHALRLAKLDEAPKEELKRLDSMVKLAKLIDQALGAFLRTAQLDMTETRDIFKEVADDTDPSTG